MENESGLHEKYREKLEEQSQAHAKEISEIELRHSNHIAHVENCYKDQVKDLEAQLCLSNNLEKVGQNSSSDEEDEETENPYMDLLSSVNESLRHKLARLEARTEKMVWFLSEEHEKELWELREIYELKRQKFVSILSEMKSLHSNQMIANAEKYENKIRVLEEQLSSLNSEKETLERQLENKREFLNKLQADCSNTNKELLISQKKNFEYELKLRHYLAENVRLKTEIDKNLMQKREKIVKKLSDVKSLCGGTEEKNKVLYLLGRGKVEVICPEVSSTSLLLHNKALMESLSYNIIAGAKCMTDPDNTREKNESRENKEKSLTPLWKSSASPSVTDNTVPNVTYDPKSRGQDMSVTEKSISDDDYIEFVKEVMELHGYGIDI